MSQTLNGRAPISIEAHTADDTLTTAECGTGHTNTGASGAVVLTLPAAALGLNYYFSVGAAQSLRIDPNGTETISLPSSGVPQAAGKYIACATVGATLRVACAVAGNWAVLGSTAVWTVEP
jgi:hypothetical protein